MEKRLAPAIVLYLPAFKINFMDLGHFNKRKKKN